MESIFPIELEINVWKEVWKLTINDVHIEMMMDIKLKIVNDYLLVIKKKDVDFDHKSKCMRIAGFIDNIKNSVLIPELHLICDLYWKDVYAYSSINEDMWDWVEEVDRTFKKIQSTRVWESIPNINDFWSYMGVEYPRMWKGERQEYTWGLH